jgi:hypothetical protein
MKTTEKTINTMEDLITSLLLVQVDEASLFHAWDFKVCGEECQDPTRPGWWMHVSFARPDIETGEDGRGRGRTDFIAKGATVSAVVKTVWVMVQAIVMHELMHGFTYRGRPLFDPHATVDSLHSISDQDKVPDSYGLENKTTNG